MTEYEELVKRLREHNGWALNETLDEAADAIEELSRKYTEERNAAVELTGELASKPHWIPVTERLPKIGETVIVAIKSKMHKGAYIVQTSFLCCDNTFTLDDVDMWMPLPEPPKEDEA